MPPGGVYRFVFMIISIIGYFTDPTVAGWVLSRSEQSNWRNVNLRQEKVPALQVPWVEPLVALPWDTDET